MSEEEEYIEPLERFSSSDVVAAIAELRFTAAPQQENENKNLLSADNWHTMHINDIIKKFNSNTDTGLNQSEIPKLQQKYGYNKLTSPSQKHWLLLYLFNCNLWFIIVSMILSLITGILFNHILILTFGILLFLLIIFSLYSAFSSHRKQQLEHSLKLLKKEVLVLRDSKQQTIESINLLPGDIIFIRMGMSITADIRIIECTDTFEIDESCINGNIEPQYKHNKIANDNSNALDSHNMLFNGCVCVSGECKGVVVAIGDETFVGKMTQLANEQHTTEGTSTSDEYVILSDRSKLLIAMCICSLSVICFVIVLILDTNNWITMVGILWFVIGVIIILIPLVMVCVVIRLRDNIIVRLLRENMFVKRRDSIYKLGDINVICVDESLLMVNDKVNDLSKCFEKFDEMNIKIVIISENSKESIELIAKQCGYLNDINHTNESVIVSGDEINDTRSLHWCDIVTRKRIIFASISAQQKMTIVNKMKANDGNMFVCMTGDGTNGCAAMGVSDFSIALGIMGTEVAKEASDIVVMDDKLESIIKGIEVAENMKQSFSYRLQQTL